MLSALQEFSPKLLFSVFLIWPVINGRLCVMSVSMQSLYLKQSCACVIIFSDLSV